jgi:hypothetical protein
MTSTLPVAVGELSEKVIEALLDGLGPPCVELEMVDAASPTPRSCQPSSSPAGTTLPAPMTWSR